MILLQIFVYIYRSSGCEDRVSAAQDWEFIHVLYQLRDYHRAFCLRDETQSIICPIQTWVCSSERGASMSTMAEQALVFWELDHSECHQIHSRSHPSLIPMRVLEEGLETTQGADRGKAVLWEPSNLNRGWSGLRCELLQPFWKEISTEMFHILASV